MANRETHRIRSHRATREYKTAQLKICYISNSADSADNVPQKFVAETLTLWQRIKAIFKKIFRKKGE